MIDENEQEQVPVLERVVVEFDPQSGRLTYRFENIGSLMHALGLLELARHDICEDTHAHTEESHATR